MTFTATFPIGYYPGSPRELFIEDAPVTVEFEADVCVERDPVEVDWPPAVERHVAVDCDMGGVKIQDVMLDVECGAWGGAGENCPGAEGRRMLIHTGVCCRSCNGHGSQFTDILPTLSPADLTRLRKECAEWAREHS